MKRNLDSGLTMIEVLAIVIIISILFSLIVGPVTNLLFRTRDVSKSEDMAKSHVQKLIPSATDVGASCVARDTDGDGYLSCDAAYKAGNKAETLALECAAPWSFNEGCKQRLLVPVGPRR